MTTDNPDDKYMTFLRTTRRKVKTRASDHDRVVVADARRALEKRNEELDRILDAVRSGIKKKRDVLAAADETLRELYDSSTTEKLVVCRVFVDARNGGTIKLVREDNSELFGEPRPLSKEEREVFGSTKSNPDMFGDPTVNEELAKKLKLTEYLSDDEPVDPAARVAVALSSTDLSDDLKTMLLSMDEEDEPSAKQALREAKRANDPAEEGGKKKRGRPKKEAAAPSLPAPPTPPVEDEPGPAVAEKDPVPPVMPRPPRATQPDDAEEPDEPDESEPADDGDVPPDDFHDAEHVEVDEAAADVHDADIDDAVAETSGSEHEPPGDVGPESEGANVYSFVEDEDAPPVDDDLPMDLDAPAPQVEEEDALPDFGEAEQVAAPPPVDVAPETPAPSAAATPSDDEQPAPAAAAAPETPPPAKKKQAKPKKADAVTPPTVDAPPAPVAPEAPAHALNLSNNFGLAPKIVTSFLTCIKDGLRKTPSFSPHAVEIASSARVNGREVDFSPKWQAALIPVLDHLAAEKVVRRRELAGGVVVYWHESHDATIDDTIAGYLKDKGAAYVASMATAKK